MSALKVGSPVSVSNGNGNGVLEATVACFVGPDEVRVADCNGDLFGPFPVAWFVGEGRQYAEVER